MGEFIYTRVSTDGQSTDPQSIALQRKYPNASIVSEIASGGKARPILDALIKQLRKDDKLIVAALDRLGRRAADVLTMIEDLTERGVVLISEREGVDYSSPVGRLVTQILVSVAEMEREMNRERTRAGLAAARAKGVKLGRPREIRRGTILRGIALVKERGYSISKAAKEVGISYPYLSIALRQADNVE